MRKGRGRFFSSAQKGETMSKKNSKENSTTEAMAIFKSGTEILPLSVSSLPVPVPVPVPAPSSPPTLKPKPTLTPVNPNPNPLPNRAFTRSCSANKLPKLFITCLVDERMDLYQQLRNAHPSKWITVCHPIASLLFITSQELRKEEMYSGVSYCDLPSGVLRSLSIKRGVIILEPRTVSKFTTLHFGDMSITVMDGPIRIKSSAFHLNEKQEPFLKSVELTKGSLVMIRQGCLYSFENWTSSSVSLTYDHADVRELSEENQE